MIGKIQGGWFPRNMTDFHKRLQGKEAAQASQDLDEALQTTMRSVLTVQQNLNGIQAGSTIVTGSKIGIATGLSNVAHVVATIDAAAVALNNWVSASISATSGAIDIRIWMPTGVADTTPIASTTTWTVRWIAFGST